MSKSKEQKLEAEITQFISEEQKLAQAEQALANVPEFQQFLQLQKDVNSKAAQLWKTVEQEMIKNGIKNIKGEFGTVTIAERLNWDTTEELPASYYKKTVDTKKLSDTYRLKGKAPKGATPRYSMYLTKRLKGIK